MAVDDTDAAAMSLIHQAVDQALRLYTSSPCEIGIQIVSRDEMRRLNREFRASDAVTDVLSFAMAEGRPVFRPADALNYLGDIAICYERAAEQATSYGHALTRELAYLGVHGMLHLLGFDHEDPEAQQTMRKAEERVMAIIGLPEPHAGA